MWPRFHLLMWTFWLPAQLLEYQLASKGQGSVEWRAHIAEVAKQNPGISGKMVRATVCPVVSDCGTAAATNQTTCHRT